MNETTVKVKLSDGKYKITVDDKEIKDIENIKGKTIEEIFKKANDRSGWKGLIEEVKKIADVENEKYNFIFEGSEKDEKKFQKCIKKLGYRYNDSEMTEDERINELLQKADKNEKHGFYAEAIECYEKAAEKENLHALYKLGDYYYKIYKGEPELNGICSDKRKAIELAVRYHRKSGNQNAGEESCKSQRWLYELYLNGNDVEKNDREAIKWLKKSADNGDTVSCYELGNCYYLGVGTEPDPEKAKYYFEIAAKKENADAQFALSTIFLKDGKYEKAFEMVKKSASNGNVYGMFFTAESYMKGLGTSEDYGEAFVWFEKAAQKGCTDAFNQLGYCYEYGYGTEINAEKSAENYEKAAEKGHAEALCSLGWCYEKGFGVEKNKKKAFEKFKISAEKNNSAALYKLGKFYEYGIYVNKNFSTAIYYYKMAADNSSEPSSEACYRIGYIHQQIYFELTGPKANAKKIAKKLALGGLSVLTFLSQKGKKKCVAFLPALGAFLSGKSKQEITKEFVDSDEGKMMLDYFEKGASLGNEDCKKALNEWKERTKEMNIS